MLRWNNDYNQVCHPAILKALEETAENAYAGYGLDEWCERGAAEIKRHLGNVDAQVHFLVGGTQANFTIIAAALRPFQGVISENGGHINSHETGAIEHTGHRIHALKGVDGKLTAEAIAREAESFRASDVKEHVTEPKMVFLSSPSEFGTIYSKSELQEIRKVCDEYGLYVFMDGARMAYGLGAEGADLTLADIAALTDVFTIGGTKCGAMFGEAVVIRNNDLKPSFRSFIKQNGGLLAKGWLLGLQFYTLFKDDVYLKCGRDADKFAMQIKAAFAKKGIKFFIDSPTNQQFPVLTDAQCDALAKNHIFEGEFRVDENHRCVRFCTGWSTKAENVAQLVADIEKL